MDPFYFNIIIASISVIYVFAVVSVMDIFVKKGFPQDISRKVVHIAAASWLLFWVFFDNEHLSKYLNITPALIWFILLIAKGLTAKPDDEAVKTMTRTGDRKELLRGPLYFTIVMMIMGTLFYNTSPAIVSMGILGWGDGLAPVFGKKYGKHRYNFVTQKSLEGSAAFLIFGFLGSVLFSFVLLDTIDFGFILISVAVTTIAEALSPKDLDNILIPATCLIIFYLL